MVALARQAQCQRTSVTLHLARTSSKRRIQTDRLSHLGGGSYPSFSAVDLIRAQALVNRLAVAFIFVLAIVGGPLWL